MSLIPTVGRKSLKIRVLIIGLYAVLSLGAVTMVYPFLVMLSTSVKSAVDVNDYSVIPKYLYDDRALFAKYVEIRYSGDIEAINSYYGGKIAKIEEIEPPKLTNFSTKERRFIYDWNKFVQGLPVIYKQANFGPIGTSPSMLLDRYRAFLRRRFNNNINALNKFYREENTSFEQVCIPFERPTKREWQPDDSPKMKEWLRFKQSLPPHFLRVVGCDPLFTSFLEVDKYEGEITKLNAAWGTNYKSFAEIHLSPTPPKNKQERADWEEFVRTFMPFRYMQIKESATPYYQAFLRKRYSGNISEVNRIYNTQYKTFDEIRLPKKVPMEGTPLADWMDFIANVVPITHIKLTNAENLFRQHVLAKYGSLDGVRKAYGIHINRITDLSPPYQLADWDYVLSHKSELRRYFLTRNYVMVLDFILLHGRAVLNTVIFCLAVIITHLVVNPLCAYALSRYGLPYAYKVLLFLLATMAFPAEVAMIPNFLLLKKLNLLNTYWALILPGMASGFAIFLLKGFFDSLPKELYEAGLIDGASEARMFWQITIPLSKPIFAVIALQSFTAAYGAFMFAFLVCQNPKMWTMMVWLYELQITAPKYITMAALTVAAIPTLLVFIFAQKVIMRGIILPSFK
jgi:multiple sugar transport system permease protein